jgi:hypothetical protein
MRVGGLFSELVDQWERGLNPGAPTAALHSFPACGAVGRWTDPLWRQYHDGPEPFLPLPTLGVRMRTRQM